MSGIGRCKGALAAAMLLRIRVIQSVQVAFLKDATIQAFKGVGSGFSPPGSHAV